MGIMRTKTPPFPPHYPYDPDLQQLIGRLDPEFVFPAKRDFMRTSGTTELLTSPTVDDKPPVDPHAYRTDNRKQSEGVGVPAAGQCRTFCSAESFATLGDGHSKIDAELRSLAYNGTHRKRTMELSFRFRFSPHSKSRYYQSLLRCTALSRGVKILSTAIHRPENENPFADPVKVSAIVGRASTHPGIAAQRIVAPPYPGECLLAKLIDAGRESLESLRDAWGSAPRPSGVFLFRPCGDRTLEGDFYVTLNLEVPDKINILELRYEFYFYHAGRSS